MISTFLSYSSNDKKLARYIRFELEERGFDPFLAHEDIEPSSDWQERILVELANCKVFIPILTNAFYGSDYTDQECGYQLAREVIVLPLSFDINPRGFLARTQALRARRDALDQAADKVMLYVAAQAGIGSELTDALIERFGRSNTFEEAARTAARLDMLPEFWSRQLQAIVAHVVSNFQIHRSFKARATLSSLLNRHREAVSDETMEAFRQAIKD